MEQDKRFCDIGTAIILDRETDLQWMAGPDKATTWQKAKVWIEKLTSEESDLNWHMPTKLDWRMPTKAELKKLFNHSPDSPLEPFKKFQKIFKTIGDFVWTLEEEGNEVWVVSLEGAESKESKNDDGTAYRVFAVCEIKNRSTEEKQKTPAFSNLLVELIDETMPSDTIAWMTCSRSYTAQEMKEEISKGSEAGKQYASDLLRCSRDFLKRKAAHAPKEKTFQNELTELLKKYSYDIKAKTPDFILAQFLFRALNSFICAKIDSESD